MPLPDMKLLTEREINVIRGKALVGHSTPADTLAITNHLAVLEQELDLMWDTNTRFQAGAEWRTLIHLPEDPR